jgi:hypothetical protein
MDLGLHIAVHARKKSFLRHAAEVALWTATPQVPVTDGKFTVIMYW